MNNVKSASIIKERCKKKGMTISQLLSGCDIRRGLIYDMEKRNKTPSAEIFETLAETLDCSVDYLLGRTNDPGKDTSNLKENPVSTEGDGVVNDSHSPEAIALVKEISDFSEDELRKVLDFARFVQSQRMHE